MHVGAVQSGERAIVVDDLVSTGGTHSASIKLLEHAGAEVVQCACVIGVPEMIKVFVEMWYKEYEQGCGTLLVTGEKLAYCRGYHFVMLMWSYAIEFAVFIWRREC
ncbi:Adenine phosphoribosyltransferase-like protein [Thalictrum thalictroides]|uniref:adenine phosphoribosyltransferase n=1 Tax=Thalictrum thalictroides TaxID=46969 RepID=A0A7J6UXQ3_THATH|nr:Adenine phosphoribosyltransferase-like protein [Thalictrum thalictroides]KAF5192907.1 Adenine phosphoribosyltransferase-like protein [Thalictrum thalictroides]